jgi:hypothetical protein
LVPFVVMKDHRVRECGRGCLGGETQTGLNR